MDMGVFLNLEYVSDLLDEIKSSENNLVTIMYKELARIEFEVQ